MGSGWLSGAQGGVVGKCLHFIPSQHMVRTILQQLHDTSAGSHLGVTKTWEKVCCRFYWPGQRHDVEQWCECCVSRKSPAKKWRAGLQTEQLPTGLFERVAMGILGPLPSSSRGNWHIYTSNWRLFYQMDGPFLWLTWRLQLLLKYLCIILWVVLALQVSFILTRIGTLTQHRGRLFVNFLV